METVEQLEVPSGLGCGEAQGYLIPSMQPAMELALETLAWAAGTLIRVPVTDRR